MRLSRITIFASLILIIVGCEPTFAQVSSRAPRPIEFQKATIFIDGTNLIW